MPQQVYSVTQINEYIQSVLDADAALSAIAVCGEISNYKLYPSGHHYFTLKDENSAIRCVMFRGNAFKLRFRPENGMRIIASGKISAYPRDGVYQLYCSHMIPDGAGDLHVAFEQLKSKLAAKGLFDPANKKPLPPYPNTIGIVTSEAGAAVHDMIRILRARYPLVKVRLFPARVQGPEAPEEIAAAIDYANEHNLADVLIVGRGGGSIEDLWAFNEEQVAYAIYRSRIPVISAVGHEPDVTISDFVADVRAATPSNAAEIAVPDQNALRQNLDYYQASIAADFSDIIRSSWQRLHFLASSKGLQSPLSYLQQRRTDLSLQEKRLLAAFQNGVGRKQQAFVGMTAKLDAMSPLKVLSRGYAMVTGEDGTVLRSVRQTEPGQTLAVTVSDGTVHATVTQRKENVL